MVWPRGSPPKMETSLFANFIFKGPSQVLGGHADPGMGLLGLKVGASESSMDSLRLIFVECYHQNAAILDT